MKRRRRNHSRIRPSLNATKDGLHFRLCHVCLHLSESESDIVQCQRCQRYLTIESLVEERLARQRAEREAADDYEDEPENPGFRRKGTGLAGLAVVW